MAEDKYKYHKRMLQVCRICELRKRDDLNCIDCKYYKQPDCKQMHAYASRAILYNMKALVRGDSNEGI